MKIVKYIDEGADADQLGSWICIYRGESYGENEGGREKNSNLVWKTGGWLTVVLAN